jgi:hypothetical protein
MSYLTKNDIIDWLHKDFDEVQEIDNPIESTEE